jgi:hypothetical protein
MSRILYVDGFNFYFEVTAYWSRQTQGSLAGLGWCDFRALIERHFSGRGELRIKYFTSPITENVELKGRRPGEHGRYALWRRALQTTPGLSVVEGFYKRTGDEKPSGPGEVRGPADGRQEKQTDVNLAVEILIDAYKVRPEHIFLLSGDCDLMPVIFALEQRLPIRPEITVLLPSSHSEDSWVAQYEKTRKRLLKSHSGEQSDRPSMPGKPVQVKVLDEVTLANSLLQYQLKDSEGSIECPHYWKLSEDYLRQHCKKHEWRPERSTNLPIRGLSAS